MVSTPLHMAAKWIATMDQVQFKTSNLVGQCNRFVPLLSRFPQIPKIAARDQEIKVPSLCGLALSNMFVQEIT